MSFSPARRDAEDLPAPPPVLAAFLGRVEAFCAATGWSAGRLSRTLFADDDRIGSIRDTPSDVGVKRLARADADLARLAAEAGVTLPEVVDNSESEPGPLRSRRSHGVRA